MGSSLQVYEQSDSGIEKNDAHVEDCQESSLKIVPIMEARRRRTNRRKRGVRPNAVPFKTSSPAISDAEKKPVKSYPYVVAKWVKDAVPCIIRGIRKNAPILSITYPGKEKKRLFSYESGRLVRVETIVGSRSERYTKTVYAENPVTGSWIMTTDGVPAVLPGRVRLSEDGVLHVQTSENGRCREEHPDGSSQVVDGCFSESSTNRDVDLLGLVGHDLRSPLMSVQGLLTLLTSGALGELSDKARTRINGVESDLSRLIRLINELLDSEMLVCGKRDLNLEPIGVSELFDAATWALAGLAERKNVRLEAVESDIRLEVDADYIIRVLVNLISNAIHHSPRDASINITASISGSEVLFNIKDDGNGIEIGDQRRIFERFEQSDHADHAGAGLGLAICKAIVESHGGTIGVTSRPGEGSTFWFRLPIR